jgi:hypothetical protein
VVVAKAKGGIGKSDYDGEQSLTTEGASLATQPPRAGLLVADSIYRLHITERSVMY